MATTQPIRNKHQVRELAEYYLRKGQVRNYVLVVLGVHTALRISDLLRFKWDDVYDFERGRVRSSISLVEGKTKKEKHISLNRAAVDALSMLAAITATRGHYIIENKRTERAISRIQAYRIIRKRSDMKNCLPETKLSGRQLYT